MKNTLRFNPPRSWFAGGNINPLFLGTVNLMGTVAGLLQGRENLKMLEIGSFMGESTFIFAAMGSFKEIHCIEPFSGDFSEYLDYASDWSEVKREFWTNTRHFKDKIHLYKDFSYNMVDKFEDKSFDLIYIDARHEYEHIKSDLEMYLPKVADGGVIAGHDYASRWPGVQRAVNEMCQKLNQTQPENVFMDNSWLVRKLP